jgi:tetratricopeptide (TPR) repeat protein
VYSFHLKVILISIYLSIGLVQTVLSQNQTKEDSLKTKLIDASTEEKFLILNQLFKQYNQSDFKVALGFATEFVDLANKVGDSVKIVEGGRMKAYSLMDLGDNDSAIEILTQILGIADRNKVASPELKKQIKFILNNAGIASNYRGNYDKALEYHFRSLQIREEDGDKRSIGTALNNIGLVFFNLKDYKKASEYLLKALEIKRDIKDNSDLDGILINIGQCFNQSGDYKRAIAYFNEAFEACKVNCSDNIRSAGLSGLGLAYYRINDLDKAQDYLLKSLAISKSQGNGLNQWSALFHLSMVETSKGKNEKALQYLVEASKMAEISGLAEPLIDTYEQFSEIYRNASDDKNYALYLSKYVKLKDSIYSDEPRQSPNQLCRARKHQNH